MDQNERLRVLFQKYFDKTASTEERIDLMRMIDEAGTDEVLQELMDATYLSFTPKDNPFGADARERMLHQIQSQIINDKVQKVAPVKQLYQKRTFKYAIAASLLIFMAIGSYFLMQKHPDKPLAHIDFVPGGNNAVLTLGNGSKIILNKAGNGTLASQGGIAVNKTQDGKVIYDASGVAQDQSAPSFNTLNTPKGGQYEIVLADGTRAWLNSVSSIHFPTSFPGKERRVEVTGEVYFEVAKNKAKPFFVKAGNQMIRVLGTHFNVNSYADEPQMETTLLEGSVEIKQTGSNFSALLKPGQQATYTNSGPIEVKNANMEQAIAWKNGYFQIDNADIATIMRQAARWYDVEIVYQGRIPQRQFSGKISRDVKASEFLQMLTYFNVHFDMEGRKIIVKN